MSRRKRRRTAPAYAGPHEPWQGKEHTRSIEEPAFDRNPADGFQDGEFRCVPVATVPALLWLADHHDRPDIIPRDAAGQRYTTDAFVRYLGERWFTGQNRGGSG